MQYIHREIFTLLSTIAIGAHLYLQFRKCMKQTKTLGIFPGLQCAENADTHNQGYKRHEATPRVCSQKSLTNAGMITEGGKKKREQKK